MGLSYAELIRWTLLTVRRQWHFTERIPLPNSQRKSVDRRKNISTLDRNMYKALIDL